MRPSPSLFLSGRDSWTPESSILATSEAFLPSRAPLILGLHSPLLLPLVYILYPSEWIPGKVDRRHVFGLAAQTVYKTFPFPPYSYVTRYKPQSDLAPAC
ncbi:hypothetical protein N7519_007393 [Penicillium mononematosum]|uniref:uncharacterized protein n=1 Tax=Penicillium mononematosum TaxID=268346 RepID=UPI00254886AB|nr:uncharacterized protein N7519_007393 [Penicillium mononematosum]KAJ6186092.1 hypothetical protein N7519_007393 [Penicillium mononematosum]